MTFKQYHTQIKQDERYQKLNFSPDGRDHYVYRVTDYTRTDNRHYYGSHTPPKNKKYKSLIDEFWTYKTSSEMNVLNENAKDNYKVKILKVFDNAAMKMIYESYLHQYFNVKVHNSFWNRSNQTPYGFDVTGVIRTEESKVNQILAVKGKKQSEKQISERQASYKKTCEDRGYYISKEGKEKMSKTHSGKTLSDETKRLISEKSKLQVHTPERRKQMSLLMSGKGNPMYGIKNTDEMKRINSIKNSGPLNSATYIIKVFNNIGEKVEEVNSYYFHRSDIYPINALKNTMKNNSKIGDKGSRVLKDKEKWEGWYIRKQ